MNNLQIHAVNIREIRNLGDLINANQFPLPKHVYAYPWTHGGTHTHMCEHTHPDPWLSYSGLIYFFRALIIYFFTDLFTLQQ